jgi:Zn-dependent protease
MPIMPLDGSKILGALIPARFTSARRLLETQSFLFVLVFIFFVWPFIEPVIPWLYKIMTGLDF